MSDAEFSPQRVSSALAKLDELHPQQSFDFPAALSAAKPSDEMLCLIAVRKILRLPANEKARIATALQVVDEFLNSNQP